MAIYLPAIVDAPTVNAAHIFKLARILRLHKLLRRLILSDSQ